MNFRQLNGQNVAKCEICDRFLKCAQKCARDSSGGEAGHRNGAAGGAMRLER